jgi:hypothetical protein
MVAMRRTQTLLPLALPLVLVLGACASAPAPRRATPEPEACREPIYLELKAEHPDSLSERSWERLQQLEAECRAELRQEPDRANLVGGDHHRGAWLWMPAMMLFGGMMWLMMGAF